MHGRMPSLTHVPGYVKGTMYMVDWPLPRPRNKTALKKLPLTRTCEELLQSSTSVFGHQFLASSI
jgi:hypothetical protein